MYELLKRGVPYYGSIYDDEKEYKKSIILWMKELGYFTNKWTCLHKVWYLPLLPSFCHRS
jgi:hypothetical protein